MDWINWRELEAQIPLEQLPDFHKAFLTSKGVQTDSMMLRRVQQSVERELNKLIQQGQARLENEILYVNSHEIPTPWLEKHQ